MSMLDLFVVFNIDDVFRSIMSADTPPIDAWLVPSLS